MTITHRKTPFGILAAVAMSVLLIGAAACGGQDEETVDLLKDPKIGLTHLNAELHTIKGKDLLASPKIGLAHLNEELHTVRELATDPKLGFEHLNAELHTLKEMLAELSK